MEQEQPTSKKPLDSKLISQSIIVAGLLIAGAILLKGSVGPSAPVVNDELNDISTLEINPVTAEDHIFGNPEASIMVVEYSDTECPYCKSFHATMHRLIAEKGDDIAWVYRHYPVPELHQKAFKESLASECAWEQGGNQGFWTYIDEIYSRTESNDRLPDEALGQIAQSMNLNMTTFNDCLDNGKYADKLTASMEEGLWVGQQLFGRGLGTPTSIVIKDGTVVDLIPGALPYENVLEIVSKY
ncbi:MAG TPA: thioredoxin domain-containing protein [Candidatus Paceibacterota bacterium]|nr:thioredoxin domain-containing protein [Candidatus Paceibacterota bacterium]